MKKTTLLPAPTAFCDLNAARRACLWPALWLLAAIATVAPPARAAVTEAWVHRYSSVVTNANDQAVKVVRDAAGDIVVTGTTEQDMLTIKYSGADGTVLWQKRYANGSAQAVAVDGSGNVVVTGSSSGDAGGSDYYTAKYAAADGALLWEQRYDGPANSYDGAWAVAVDGSGNVVVTGYSNNGTNADYYTAKYAAANGALVWEKRYNSPANSDDYARAVAVDGSGNVVVTGSSQNGAPNYLSDYYTAKYAAADGTLLWEKRYNGPSEDYASAVAVDGSGNVVVTGSSSGDAGGSDYYTAKYAAADGALLWEQRYDGSTNGDDGARAVAVDGSGNVVVTGSSYNANYDHDYYTAKYAALDGALLWEQRYNGPGNSSDAASAVAVDGGGNVVVTGYSHNETGHPDYYTAKYAAANGALLWEQRYHGSTNSNDQANAVAVDGSGNVVVTGLSNHGAPNYDPDYYTAKYAAADGAQLWEKRYNGPANRWGFGAVSAVAVDGSGNVAVTGVSNVDYYTAKYAATDGTLLWEKRYNNGPENSEDYARALAVDRSGNVVVTGTVGTGGYYGPFGDIPISDYYTARYAAADGALLWEKRYNGPANSGDIASAVAVDGSGNVVVTGISFGSPSNDYYTAKYAATDGTLLWEKRYNGPANSGDIASAVAVDGSGNVVVTGDSNGGASGSDYYTAKYAAANGALLWEKRYNGPANARDEASAVAVDGSGNVVVTGISFGTTTADHYTAKYAAENGALLWEHRYNGGDSLTEAVAVAVDGSGNVVVTGTSHGSASYYTAKYAATDGTLLWEQRHEGRASAVAVDVSGNVVVTGSSYDANHDQDYYTAKYAAADGALLWEKRYNGPANRQDFVGGSSSLALGPNGMVAVAGSSSDSSGSYDYATVVYREIPPPLSFAGWAACFDLSGGAAAADADPDSDGLPNGVEYILGGNPIVPNTSASLTVTASGGNMVFTFPRDDGSETPDVTLTVETGTTLLTWPTVFTIGPTTAASSPGVSIAENGAAPDAISVTIAQGTAPHMFARLKVMIAP